MSEATVKDYVTAKTHPYRIKVYRVKVTSGKTNGVWYASKKGQTFFVVLSVKDSYEGYIPTFREVSVSEGRTYIIERALIRDIHPNDCTVIEEFTVRSSKSLRHLSIVNT
jgi:hypothetical protein